MVPSRMLTDRETLALALENDSGPEQAQLTILWRGMAASMRANGISPITFTHPDTNVKTLTLVYV